MEDFDEVNFGPMRRICETLRMNGVIAHNTAMGRKQKDIISDPVKLYEFSWDKPKKTQTLEEMRAFILGMAGHENVTVKQGDKEIK